MRRVSPYRFVPQTSDPAASVGRTRRGSGLPLRSRFFLLELTLAVMPAKAGIQGQSIGARALDSGSPPCSGRNDDGGMTREPI
jgi:hypothetical protein